jgi:hypothetical protein
MSKNTLQIFQTLPGQWRIKRELPNHGSASGLATVTQFDDPHNYKEEVRVKFSGYPDITIAHQEYTFKYNPHNNTIKQLTSSAELMYELEIDGGGATGRYLCGSDSYLANYHFIEDNKFTLTYIVQGPYKNYTISTIFEKILLS